MRLRLIIVCVLAVLGFVGARVHAQTAPTLGNPVVVIESASAEANHVLKAAQGNLYALSVTSSAAGYATVFNALSATSTGTVTPVLCEAVPAAGTAHFNLPYPVPFTTGIVAEFSSVSCYTNTPSATAFFAGQVR